MWGAAGSPCFDSRFPTARFAGLTARSFNLRSAIRLRPTYRMSEFSRNLVGAKSDFVQVAGVDDPVLSVL